MNYFKFQRIKRLIKQFSFIVFVLMIVCGIAYYGFYDFSIRAAGMLLFIGAISLLVVILKALVNASDGRNIF